MPATITGGQTGTVGLINTATAQNSTSGTSIDFTSIPSGVRRVTVMFNGVSGSGTSNIIIRLGSGSVASSGYLSATGYLYSASSPAVTTDTTSFIVAAGGGASQTYYGQYIFSLLNASTYTWVGDGNFYRSDAAQLWPCAGNVVLSGALDRVRVTTANGTDTFDSGSINILYE